MSNVNFNIFNGYYSSLDSALKIIPHEKIRSIIFSRRQDTHSVCLQLHRQSEEDEKTFEKLIGVELDEEFYETPHGWVGSLYVDLESIGTSQLRIYKDQRFAKTEFSLIGYYLDDKNITGYKTYSIYSSDNPVIIKYYDTNNNLVDTQTESSGSFEDWNGSQELFDAVEENNLEYVFSKKDTKDQGYFIVSTS